MEKSALYKLINTKNPQIIGIDGELVSGETTISDKLSELSGY
ncbi:hypothetical protein [Allopseudospirillum japonicum]|nr:hypothetical protein [Allopseudospirillum japonicum]